MNRNFRIFIQSLIILFFILSSGNFSFAQKDGKVKISKRITWVDGKQYYLHTVKKGETLQALSKAYNVLPKDIVIENPSAMDGVKPDQVLKIPMVEDKENFIYHTVEKGQTLYSISKKYQVEINDLIKLNPSVEDGLKVDMILKIAKKKEGKGKEKDTQSDVINKEKSKVSDKDGVVYHTVEKGQGINAILKKYHITIDDLYEANPELKSRGLRKDEKLIIPKTKKKNENKSEKIVTDKDKKKEETDKKKEETDKKKEETEKRRIELDEMKKEEADKEKIKEVVNEKKQVTESIKTDTITTPVVVKDLSGKEEKLAPPDVKPCGTFDYKSNAVPFKIAFLAPFYINLNLGYTLKAGRKKDEEPPIHPKSIKFLEFYQGFLLALDSLKSAGFNAEILTYDTNKDSARLVAFADKKEFSELDLIIGPFFSTSLKQFSFFSAKKGVPLISPLSQSADFLNNNPYAFQVNATNTTQIDVAADFFSNSKDKNFIVVNTGREDEVAFINHFKAKIYEYVDVKFKSDPARFKEIIYKEVGFNGLREALDKDLDNIIFIPSIRESFLVAVLNKLNAISEKNNITVLGFPSWASEDNIEQDYLFNLQYTYFTSLNVSYASDTVKKFVQKYREYFSSEPTKYSFQGYDIGLYFGSALMKYGRSFPNCIEADTTINKIGTQTEFNFKRTKESCGFENVKTYIIQFDKEYNINNVTPGK